MASKKQKEHMVQNVLHRVTKDIRQMEQDDRDPAKVIEREIRDAYWNMKYEEDCKELPKPAAKK